MTKQRPHDVFFLSNPRTLSNLFVKLLSAQSGFEESGYYLHNGFEYALRNFGWVVGAKAEPEMRQEFVRLLREGYGKLLDARESAHNNVKSNHPPKPRLRLFNIDPQGNAMFLKSHVNQIWEPSPFYEGTRSGEYAAEFTLTEQPPAVPSSNPTMLTDDFLTSFVPVFLIRHPVLVVDSWYRTDVRAGITPDLALTCRKNGLSYEFTRKLYDWYVGLVADSDTAMRPGDKAFPLVLDADDVVEGGVVQRFAKTVGMDPEQVLSSWEAKSTEGLDSIKKSYVQGIWESTGVDKSKSSKFLDVEAKYKSWRELYGKEVGDYLVALSEEFMPDYEYMKSKKM